MAQIKKLIERLESFPKDFTWDEVEKILSHFGYQELKKGKTGGARRKFADASNHIISMHKPHPKKIMKRYQLEEIVHSLKERGKL